MMHYSTNRFFKALALVLFLSLGSTLAATSLFDLLANDGEALPATLTADHDALQGSARATTSASLNFTDIEGNHHSFDLRLAQRGRFRRHVCDHAPLKLDFKKGELSAAGLTDHDKYKLVVPCFSGSGSERLVLKEYLAYRAYRLLTPNGFRVRLLSLTLADTDGKGRSRQFKAFIIESKTELADRLMVGDSNMDFGWMSGDFAPKAEVTQSLFQYLIGNTDWDIAGSRNLKTFETATGDVIPIGYDFDFSAWVAAPYAIPRKEVGQHSVQQRVYLGNIPDIKLFMMVTDHFVARRDALTNLVETSDLPAYERRRLLRLIDGFYKALPELMEMQSLLQASLVLPSSAPAPAP